MEPEWNTHKHCIAAHTVSHTYIDTNTRIKICIKFFPEVAYTHHIHSQMKYDLYVYVYVRVNIHKYLYTHSHTLYTSVHGTETHEQIYKQASKHTTHKTVRCKYTWINSDKSSIFSCNTWCKSAGEWCATWLRIECMAAVSRPRCRTLCMTSSTSCALRTYVYMYTKHTLHLSSSCRAMHACMYMWMGV